MSRSNKSFTFILPEIRRKKEEEKNRVKKMKEKRKTLVGSSSKRCSFISTTSRLIFRHFNRTGRENGNLRAILRRRETKLEFRFHPIQFQSV